MQEINVKLPDMKRLLPERAELVEAVSVNAAELVMECVRDNFLRAGGGRVPRTHRGAAGARLCGGECHCPLQKRSLRLGG